MIDELNKEETMSLTRTPQSESNSLKIVFWLIIYGQVEISSLRIVYKQFLRLKEHCITVVYCYVYNIFVYVFI